MILSDQPEDWQSFAIQWIIHNTKRPTKIYFTSNKVALLSKDDILIEDHPHLLDYSQVLLIDRSYNKNIQLPHKRIYTPHHLFDTLLERHYARGK
jgi:hypothetical protein